MAIIGRILAPLLLVFSFVTAGVAKEPGREPQADELFAGLVDFLEVRKRGCTASAYVARYLPIATCGKLPRKARKDPDALRSATDAYFEQAGSTAVPRNGVDGWRVDEMQFSRSFSAGELRLDVSFDTASGWLILRYPSRNQPCPGRGLRVVGEDERVSDPKRVSKTEPVFPPEANRERVSGYVNLLAVVRADGSVGELCVLYARPHGAGFEQAAIDAVRQWRYEPARLDGQAIDVEFSVKVSFRIH